MENKKNTPIPNLFDHATSELSQDAILAWLLRWADPQYAQADPQLNQVGQFFIRKLYEKAGKEVPLFTSLKVSTQENRIDILVRLNCADGLNRGILIEDKIRADEHNDQLIRYRSTLIGKGIPDEHILAVYIKTVFQPDWAVILEKAYTPFTVIDLHEVWQIGVKNGINNAIFIDYALYLEKKHMECLEAQRDYQNYPFTAVKNWGEWHWKGFFTNMLSKLSGTPKIFDEQNKRERMLILHSSKVPVHIPGNDQSFLPYLDLLWSNQTKKAHLSVRVWLDGQTGFTQEIRNTMADALKKQVLYQKGTTGIFRTAKITISLLRLKLNTDIYDDAAKLEAHLLELNEQLHRLPATIDPINRT